MTDDPKDKLTPTGQGMKIGLRPTGAKAPLWARQSKVLAEKAQRETEAIMKDNRLVLMLDISGSMGGHKMECLHTAYTKFIESVDFGNTAVGVRTFPFYDLHPEYGTPGVNLGMTSDAGALSAATLLLEPTGSTPMRQAMEYVRSQHSLTRGILISDGQPDDQYGAFQEAEAYREMKVPIDCVHIGDSTSGEDVLQRIAELTGGIYIKFRDVDAFAKALTYLTPRHRAMLTSGQVGAAEIGATEVKYLGGK